MSDLGDAARKLAFAESEYEDTTRQISRLQADLERTLAKQTEVHAKLQQAKRDLLFFSAVEEAVPGEKRA